MKAISLWQPWASAIALDLKHYETRSWACPAWLIGQPLAIHAAKKHSEECALRWVLHRLGLDMSVEPPADLKAAGDAYKEYLALPFGAVVCTVKVVRCWESPKALARITKDEARWGDYGPNRFAWELELKEVFATPIPTVGRQGLFDWMPPGANP